MAKFLKNTLAFSIAVTAVVLILNFCLGRCDRGHASYRLPYKELNECNTDSNFIIIGTSHARHGIRPSLLNLPGKRIYNFALNGAGPEFFYKWYTNLFKHSYQKPEYILYAINWFAFDEYWMHRHFEHDSEYFPANVFWQNLVDYKQPNTKALVFNRFPFLKYNEPDALSALKNFRLWNTPDITGSDRGFSPLSVSEKGTFEAYTRNQVYLRQVEFFNKLIALFVDEGIKVIFVDIPECVQSDFYADKEAYKIFESISAKYDIPILNYNIDKRSDINADRKLYRDWGHLNSKGSVEFSNMLSDDLIKLLEGVHN